MEGQARPCLWCAADKRGCRFFEGSSNFDNPSQITRKRILVRQKRVAPTQEEEEEERAVEDLVILKAAEQEVVGRRNEGEAATRQETGPELDTNGGNDSTDLEHSTECSSARKRNSLDDDDDDEAAHRPRLVQRC